MTRRVLITATFALIALPALAGDERASGERKTSAKAVNDKAETFFEMRVRPLLAKNCFACHTASRMGGLEMKSREALIKGGKSGAAIIPGKPDESLMIQAVRQEHERLKMPPQGKLSEEEIADLSAWIRDGAVWPEAAGAPAPKTAEYVITPAQKAFWSFQPVKKPLEPKVSDSRWVRTPVDRFILAKLEEKALKPVAPADKRTLLRRATYDLTGLPPTAEEIDAFLNDKSPRAYEKVIDRLLASPRYGERWGRHWLDVARYSDDKLDPTGETPHPNAFRYRDWVIKAFNDDMPYDLFVKAQIAGDLLAEKEKTAAGLGLYALSPEFQDDRVDVTTRGFLGLTVACAQCHDHKFDPIPTKDYYSLLGIFNNTKMSEFPLASADVVNEYKERKKQVDDQEKVLKDYVKNQAEQLAQIFAAESSAYMIAARTAGEGDYQKIADEQSLDAGTLKRWADYLKKPSKEHPFLKPWDELVKEKKPESEFKKFADGFQELAVKVFNEKKAIDEQNVIRLGGSMERGALSSANLLSLERDKYFLWRDLFNERNGILYYGDKSIDRFLSGQWKTHLTALRDELQRRKKAMPEQYPFLQIVSDVEKPAKQKVFIRGDRNNLGDEVAPHFVSILSDGAPKPFATKGSGRLELAEAIADPKNPLTARVIVNRLWQWHFGVGLVRTTSNFGQLGERPSHPELLDYLASKLIESKWSIKAMQRELMLSATYMESTADSAKAEEIDSDNRLLWRANRHRLDAEEVRDSLLFVAGKLENAEGGKPARLTEENHKRTVYAYVSRKKLDQMLALFDFPNPNTTSEQRVATNVPLQSLFFLNSPLVIGQADALAERFRTGDDAAGIQKAYTSIFGRAATPIEVQLGLEFLRANKEKGWSKYLQVLLSSNEFLFIG